MRQQAKLLNSEGEVVAEGDCELKRSAPGACDVTMWIPVERALMERQQGPMTLMLEDGPSLEIAEERRLKFRINGSAGGPSFIYKMRVVEQQDAPERHAAQAGAEDSLPTEGRTFPTHL